MEGETLETFYIQLVLMPKVLHYAQYVLLKIAYGFLIYSCKGLPRWR